MADLSVRQDSRTRGRACQRQVEPSDDTCAGAEHPKGSQVRQSSAASAQSRPHLTAAGNRLGSPEEMRTHTTGEVASACAAIAAVLLVGAGCGKPGRPTQITCPSNNDTVWGKVMIRAEPVGGIIPTGGLDFYLDNHKLGNVADPLMCTRTFEYIWNADTLSAASVHTLGVVTKGGKAPKPPQAIHVTIDSAPVLSVTQNRTSYWRVARIVLRSNWSTVLIDSLGLLGGKSIWRALKEPVLLKPNATVLLHEEEFRSTHPLPVVITYRSLIGNRDRGEVAANAVKTETLAMNAAEPTTLSRELLPDTR